MSFYLVLFILTMGCKEESPEIDLDASPVVNSSEILRKHYYRGRFNGYDYEEAWCSGTQGFNIYMTEVWVYEDTLNLESRYVNDTINRYYICKREDRPDQEYYIHFTDKPGIDTSDPADTICLPEAIRIVAYEDRNQNEQFEEEEAMNQLSFCNGIFPKGAIVIFREELDHDCCTAEGWKITLGQDDNEDNILQDSEIDDTIFRCNEL